MARSNIPMVINLRQNTNDDSTAFGKWFAEVDSKEPLRFRQAHDESRQDRRLSDVCTCARTGRRVHERAALSGSAREARRSRHVQPRRRRPG